MMWSVGILLAVALSVESYSVHDLHERLNHGRQLKIYLPKNAERLEFTPADEPGKTFKYWERGRVSKGRVSGTGSDRRWYIDKVTYEDEGTYTQRDYWNKEISTVKVAVTPRRNYVKCVAGKSLYISLEGIDLADAFLSFSGESGNVTLVREGARVSQDLPDYWDRVETHSMNIEIKNVNTSDEGRYTLRDRRDRTVSITRMDLTDHEYAEGNPLMALLLLLGIPAGICCCCRKKIFRKKSTAATQQVFTDPPPPAAGPAGPCPPYTNPGQPGTVYYQGPDPNMGPVVQPPPPGPGQWNGPPPSPGFNPGYPPQNPAYPPPGPAMYPSPQPPQWNGPPPGQYPPGPAAPMVRSMAMLQLQSCIALLHRKQRVNLLHRRSRWRTWLPHLLTPCWLLHHRMQLQPLLLLPCPPTPPTSSKLMERKAPPTSCRSFLTALPHFDATVPLCDHFAPPCHPNQGRMVAQEETTNNR